MADLTRGSSKVAAGTPTYRSWPPERVPLDGGLVDSIPAHAIEEGQTPACLNVDFDDGSVKTARGCRKFNNQTAPPSALRFEPDPAQAKNYIASGKSVPLRNYLELPYAEEHDIGGSFDFEGTFPSSDTYHNRRGRNFEVSHSFSLPIEERLYTQDSKGSGAPATPDPVYNPFHGFDEALDDCHVFIGKGCDGNAPMSWAIGVVNIGKQAAGDASGLTAPASRVSNYAIVFMWYDAAQWGESIPAAMKYALASGVNPSAAGSFSTQAFRAIIFHKFIEPGRECQLALQVKIDTGSPGGVAANTAWNHDGFVKLWVREDSGPVELVGSFVDSSGGGTAVGIDVYKGPTDSLRYLSKYGIRFAGRDSMQVGLGMRSLPWQSAGFVPYGVDAAPLENGGWRMIDRSANTADAIFGVGVHTLTGYKNANADAFLRVNHAGLSNGNTNGGIDPMATNSAGSYQQWVGLGGGVTGLFNPEALRGYRLVTTADFTPGTPDSKGAIFSILTYAENAGNHEVTILGGSSINAFGAVGTQFPLLIQAFRWNQRACVVGEVRIWTAPRAYDDADLALATRRRASLRRSLDLADQTEPDLSTLAAYWPLDDGGGKIARERVFGRWRNGQLAPFGAGVTDGGERGPKMLYLSGEGEALTLDLSTNPIAKRELAAMLAGDSQGFAIEITCVFTRAMYAIMGPTSGVPLPDGAPLTGIRPRFVPDILSWDVREPESSGYAVQPRSIISLSYRALRSDPLNAAPFTRPAGFGVEIGVKGDQQDVDPIVHSDLLPWYLSGGVNVSRYDTSAAWVGRIVTMVVGIQAVSADTYKVFLAMHPKQNFLPASADPGDAEFAYVTTGGTTYDFSGSYYQSSTVRIERKELERSIVTIGGGWRPRGLGYRELNCPMLVNEVRIFGCSPPGALPTTNGGVLTNRDGKLEGLKAMPQRALTEDDILEPLGANLAAVDVTDGSTTVRASGSARFFTAESRDTRDSVKGAYLAPRGDIFDQPNPERPSEEVEEFYLVRSVSSDGATLTTDTPTSHGTRRNAGARVFRLLGYTSFEDDVESRELPVGSGPAYNPASSTTADAILTEPFFENKTPIGGGFGFRIYGPGVRVKLPQWVRGHVSPRRLNAQDGILGIASIDSTIYAATRGALFECDDRWRPEGPDERVTKSLAFRSLPSERAPLDIVFPLQGDRLVFDAPQGLTFLPSPAHAYATRYDTWVKLDVLASYQTVLWIGDPTTDPSKNAGTHRVHMIQRLNRGRPELVLGSTALAAGSVTPEKGLWIATASVTVDDEVFSHIRWELVTRDSGGTSVLKKPYCFVNGRPVSVTVSAVENHASITASTDWLRTSTIVQPGSLGVAIVGVARDSYLTPPQPVALTSVGVQFRPQRVQGYIHGLCGSIAELVCTTVATPSGTPPSFDPHALTYSDAIDTTFDALGPNAEGVGAKVQDHAADQFGVILSHPFISLWHQFGQSDDMVSFARFGQQLYAVNGGRMVLLNNGTGAFAGVLPPESELDFTLERLPLWEKNARSGAANPDNDPIPGAVDGAALQINHLRASGNAYLKQALTGADATAMLWEKDDYFHFKTLWKCDSNVGRVPIWRKGASKESGGPFAECRDGALFIGWYDVLLKKEVELHTIDGVFPEPGWVYYVNVRKRWPQDDAFDGNWTNSFYSDGRIRRTTFSANTGTFQLGETLRWPNPSPGVSYGIVVKVYGANAGLEYIITTGTAPTVGQVMTGDVSGATGTATASTIRPMHDIAIVRRFRKVAGTNLKDNALEAMVSATALADNWSRNCISFTTQPGPSGCTASGMVSLPGAVFTGAPAGAVNTGVAPKTTGGVPAQNWGTAIAGQRFFHPDMCGMFFQFASGTFAGRVYRIVAVPFGNQITVQELDGTTPNLTGPVNVAGGVFAGIALKKGADFDGSTTPDPNSSYDVEFMGSAQAGDILSGIAPHKGRTYSPGWGITAGAGGTDARCFEALDSSAAGLAGTDPIAIGTDAFPAQLYDAVTGAPGPLRYDNGTQFFCCDGQTYTAAGWAANISTQPSSALTVSKDPHAANTAPTCTATALPTWTYLQEPSEWAARRFFAVAFFDTEQNLVSNPGPILDVQPAGEDATNPSGTVRAILKRLPTAPAGVTAELWIYESVGDGSSAAQFRVLRVPDLTSETTVEEIEARISEGVALEFDNGEPPQCRVIANSHGRLVAAALTDLDQLDGIVASKIERPAQFVYSLAQRLNTGAGSSITGLIELDGLLLAMKRNGVFSITISPDTGQIVAEIITRGAGCVALQSVAELDGRAIWRGNRGLYHAARGASASDLAAVRWLSERIRRLFESEADRQFAHRSSACVSNLRDQYLCTVKLADTSYSRERVSAMRDVFSRYRGPNVTALAAVPDRAGGPDRIVAGTQEGFLVWLDMPDEQLLMMGATEDADGSSAIRIATSGSTVSAVLVGYGEIDEALEGMRGVPLRFNVGGALHTPSTGQPFMNGGVEYEATVLSTEGGILHLDRPVPVAPTGTSDATLGALLHEWRSKMSDLGTFQRDKSIDRLDIELSEGATGRLRVEIYADRNQVTPVATFGNLAATSRVVSVPVAIKARHVQARIRSEPLTAGGAWELTAVLWRVKETDQQIPG